MKNNLNPFVVADLNKCIGCKACELACFAVHNKNNNVGYTVGTVMTPVIPRLYLVKTPSVTMPIQCRQCEDAPCAKSCSVGAISQKDNTIIVDEKKCIGCKNCLMACPFGAIDLLPQYDNGEEVIQLNLKEESYDGLEKVVKFTAYKCDLCIENDKKACINACPNNALRVVKPLDDKKYKNKMAAQALVNATKNYIK
ncbi:4Fe-4S dicluster domain-containing protein [Tepidibacter mesophilus]|uniref:4Fe-4S dicluster domain-containing protein n=1 Tax=Tepidibacter mesophilus TaxID=655607 RepID=UPI000C078042|nr:4Fe-4S dicluster domain-containing protein [Tepidibacter mesophilus]